MNARAAGGKVLFLITSAIVAGCFISPALARSDVGYRKLMLGQSRDRAMAVARAEFGGEYAVSEEKGGTVVMTRMRLNKPDTIIVLVFDYDGVLYRINVKMVKNRTNPPPDEVVKVIEAKYGLPEKKTIAHNLDLTAYWRLDSGRYEIFFQNVTAWDKFEVQYTDTRLEKNKEAREKEMNKKPADKNIDF